MKIFLSLLTIILLTSTSGTSLYAGSCMDLGTSDDDTPAQYRQQECLGKVALKKGEYFAAEEHFKKALSIDYNDMPNFHLKVELAVSLCRQGKKKSGIKELANFYCMANAELGNVTCPKTFHGFYGNCFRIACKDYSYELSTSEKKQLKKRILQASKVDNFCESK